MAMYQQALQPQQYVDANGQPIYIQPQATPVLQYTSSPDQNIPPISAQPQPYPQVYVPAVAANPIDDNLGADQSGLGRFVLRHQGTSRKNAAGQVKVHQQKTFLGGYGRIAEYAEAYFFLAIELFKIMMACLLAVFVPQGCEPKRNAILYTFDANITIATNYTNAIIIPTIYNMTTINNSTNITTLINTSINIGNGTLMNGQTIIGNGVIRNNQFFNDSAITYNNVQVAAPDRNTHECSFEENFQELTDINIAALVFNFLALFVCIFHYWLLLRRERFFIDHFDADPKKNRINLRFQVTAFPKIESQMYRLNLLMFWTSILCIIILVINVILSAILVFRDFYLSERTVTVFITNCLLLGTTMTRTAESAFLGAHNNIALSSIDYEPVSYNVVDELYIKAKYGDEPNKQVEMAGLSQAPDSSGR